MNNDTNANIIKSENDNREYEHIVLPNKLQVLFISDVDTDISAASMAVNVGNYYDPANYNGLAHFLEHMLFMGTKKYPNENHFMNYLNDHGGNSNAFTGADITNYFFDIHTENFDEAFDIFINFFIDPLFNSDSVNREIEAVDSEHTKNYNSDLWRLNRLTKELSDKNHPYYNFGTGNLDTLKKDNIRNVLINFYNKYYSANIMKLVILTNKTINEMKKIFIPSLILIKNKEVALMKFNFGPYDYLKKNNDSNNMDCLKLIKFKPINEENTLSIIWQLPNMDKYYCNKPVHYIGHLLGHEGEGSFIYELKRKNLAISLYAGSYEEDDSMTLFAINIQLTDYGLDYIPSIIDIIYNLIDKIKNNRNSLYYDELEKMGKINFKFLDKSSAINYVMRLSSDMIKIPIKHILHNPFYFKGYTASKSIIDKVTSYLTRNNSIIITSSPQYKKSALTKKEKYYDINYIDFDKPLLINHYTNKPVPNDIKIHLPKKNIFIPKNIKLFSCKEFDYPKKIKNKNKNMNIWFKPDNKFKKPKILGSFIFFFDKGFDAFSYTVYALYGRLFDNHLASFSYYASLANSYFSVSLRYDYIQFDINIYHNNSDIIIKKLVDSFLNMEISNEELDMVKREHRIDMINFKNLSLHIQGHELLKEKSYNRYFNNRDILSVLKNLDKEITLDDIYKIRNYFVSNMRMRCLLQGNIDEKLTNDIVTLFNKFINNNDNNVINVNTNKNSWVKGLDAGHEEIYFKKACKDEKNNFINVFYEIGKISGNNWENKIAFLLLCELIVKEKFFDQLRSKEQLGYIVKAYHNSFGYIENRINGITFMIQSPKKGSEYLKRRIKKFIDHIKNVIDTTNDKKFNKLKNTLKNQLLSKDDNLHDEFTRNLNEVMSGKYVFDFKEVMLKFLPKYDLILFRNQFNNYFINRHSRKMRIIMIDK